MQTKAGGKKVRAIGIAKYGSHEAFKEHMRAIASKGGQATVPKGFGTDPKRASLAGMKGGTISTRSPRAGKLTRKMRKFRYGLRERVGL